MRAILGQNNPAKKNVSIQIGGSKSESNRLLILKAQYPNISIENLSASDDTKVLQKGLRITKGTVDIHHSGTAMRFLTAYFSAKEGSEIILRGSSRMHERPIGILVDALRNLGADIEYLQNKGFPPLKINGKTLQKEEVTMQSNISSQYISAIMLIAPMLSNGLKITLEGEITSIPYIEMTLSLLKGIGIEGSFNTTEISISSVQNIPKTNIIVESDWSSASYFYSLVALSNDLKITLQAFFEESIQGDSILPKIYKTLGVQTRYNPDEKSISLSKNAVQLPDSLMLDLSNTPDLAQTLAVSCFGLGIGCDFKGLQTLKIKETDRLSALKNELTKLGAEVQIDKSSLQLEKSSLINSNVTIETYQDHRMGMAFAPLALKTNLIINDAEVVSKSYPKFWDDLQSTGIGCQVF